MCLIPGSTPVRYAEPTGIGAPPPVVDISVWKSLLPVHNWCVVFRTCKPWRPGWRRLDDRQTLTVPHQDTNHDFLALIYWRVFV